MKTQLDYETDSTLAVFESAAQANLAASRLQAMKISTDAIRHVPLAPGIYQLADPSLGEEVAGILRGAEFGLPAGAALGLGVAASLGGAGPEVFAGLAGAGALVGAIVGSMDGAAVRARYDDDVAESIELPAGSSALLLVVETHSDGTTGQARNALKHAGALAFLDPELYPLENN